MFYPSASRLPVIAAAHGVSIEHLDELLLMGAPDELALLADMCGLAAAILNRLDLT